MGEEELCEAGLVLGLGYEGWTVPAAVSNNRHLRRSPLSSSTATAAAGAVEPSLTLSLSDDTHQSFAAAVARVDLINTAREESNATRTAQQLSPGHSTVSSFSNAYPSSSTAAAATTATGVKREKEVLSEEVEAERFSSRISDEDEEGSARKKLRLTKEQSALLEDRFKEHSTLNPKQKQALAKQLNLRPRQVEVWFQNRRARTKLKQTEVDCEFLKRCCETLTDENRRLQKELQELKALKFAASPFYMQLPAATLSMCPSCERITGGGGGGATHDAAAVNSGAGGGGGGGGGAGGAFVMAPKTHFYNPFATTHPPSAAC